MLKLSKKITAALMAGVMAVSAAVSSSAYVWYSDDTSVKFYESTPSIRVARLWTTTTLTRKLVEGWVKSASDEWANSKDYAIPNDFISGSGTGTITVHAGKPEKMEKAYGQTFLGKRGNVVNGRTVPKSSVYDTIKINGKNITIRKGTSAVVYIVDKKKDGVYKDRKYSARTDYGHLKTAKHELGHALGYIGNCTSDNDIMTGDGTDSSSERQITSRDRRQIWQFLNYKKAQKGGSFQSDIIDNTQIIESEKEFDELSLVENSLNFVDCLITGVPVNIFLLSICLRLMTLQPKIRNNI